MHCKRFYHVFSKQNVLKFLGMIMFMPYKYNRRLQEVDRICFPDFKTWKSKEHSITNVFQQIDKAISIMHAHACVCVCVCQPARFSHMEDYKHKVESTCVGMRSQEHTHTHTTEAFTVMPRPVVCNSRILRSRKDCGKFELHKHFYLLYRWEHFKNKEKIVYTFSFCITVMY